MKKVIIKCVLGCVGAVSTFPLWASERGVSQDARDALQLINHINCAVAEITESKDPLVLEREYNALVLEGSGTTDRVSGDRVAT